LQVGNILLTSLQDGLTDRELIDLQTDLLDTIGAKDAQGVVLDVSALEVVDSYLVRRVTDTARMASVLGCSVAISGIRPAVAMTLVELREEIGAFATALNLERGVEMVKRMIGEETDDLDAVSDEIDEKSEEQTADDREEFSEAD
jgi:rsbT antagonist protein RsbS